MTKYLLPFIVAELRVTAAQEVSVFDSSDGSNGLSSSEKHILKNQASINSLSSKMRIISDLESY